MPARLRDIIAHVARFEVEVEKPSSGSHYKFKKAGFRTYPIASHNGERGEIDDVYVRKICKHFGIPELK